MTIALALVGLMQAAVLVALAGVLAAGLLLVAAMVVEIVKGWT